MVHNHHCTNNVQTINAGESIEKREHSYTVAKKGKLVIATVENGVQVFKMIIGLKLEMNEICLMKLEIKK